MLEETTTKPTRTLCLGEALVDMICEHPIVDLGDVTAFVPHCGGAVASVSVTAARAGARVAFAGGVGADAWGDWIAEQLEREAVDVGLLQRVDGTQTTLALTTLDAFGEAEYTMYGDSISAGVAAHGQALDAAVRDSGALFFGSNSLVGDAERTVTLRAREVALAHDRVVVFDPNFRLSRWPTRSEAQATALECVPGAFLVRLNLAEAELMTGEREPERAATALLKAGARMVIITLGDEGAMLRGEFRRDVNAVQAHVVSTVGAGDAFTGTVLARLALSNFYPPAVAAALPQAVAAAAAACERWGAID